MKYKIKPLLCCKHRYSQWKVARHFIAHRCTISRLLRRYRQIGSVNDRPILDDWLWQSHVNKRTYGNVTCGIGLRLLWLRQSKRLDVMVGSFIYKSIQNIETSPTSQRETASSTWQKGRINANTGHGSCWLTSNADGRAKLASRWLVLHTREARSI